MTDKADISLKESLSALLDGEASELELRRVLKAGDQDTRSLWQRYQMISALVRNDCHSPVEAKSATQFSESVLAAIDAEDRGELRPGRINEVNTAAVYQSGNQILASNWFAGMGKLAVAASVMLVMLLGFNQYQLTPASGTSLVGEIAGVESAVQHPGDTSAVVPDGYQVPSLSAMTVSSQAGAPVRNTSSINFPLPSVVSATPSESVEYSPELQAQLQRMLTLHSDSAASELGLTIVSGSRLSAQDTPKE